MQVPHQVRPTCEALAAVSDLEPEDAEGRQLDLRRQLKECATKLARYRELLAQDANITVAATWIADVERERKGIERDLGLKPTARKLTKLELMRPSSPVSPPALLGQCPPPHAC
jgi:hypothetical protein